MGVSLTKPLSNQSQTSKNLRQAALCAVTEDMLTDSLWELEHCRDIFQATNVTHPEVYCGTGSYKTIIPVITMYPS